MRLEPTMFREYDIRGKVSKEELNEQSVYRINRAFGTFLRKRGLKKAIVGYDSRPSSPLFNKVTTQALLDLYTIKQNFDKLEKLTVVLLGDLKYGRTTKSLAKLLSIYNNKVKLILISPKDLRMPREEIQKLKTKRMRVEETQDLNKVIGQADVLYATRIQKEWFVKEKKLALYNKLKAAYVIDKKLMKKAKKKMILIHPLPRVGEIASEVDSDPRSKYFPQMRNGLYIRMALLRLILLGS